MSGHHIQLTQGQGNARSRFIGASSQGRRHGFLPGVASRSRGLFIRGPPLRLWGLLNFFFVVCQKAVYLQFYTRTGGGDILCPLTCFHEYLKKRYTLFSNFDFPGDQVKRSGHQARPKSDVHSGTCFVYLFICLLSPEQPQAPGPLTAAVTYPQAHALAHTHT